jgi:opacity protein-like surface antigen
LPSAIAGFLSGSLTVTPHVLPYATGGGAWVRGNVDVLEPENAILSATARPTRSGWVAGVGAEILMQDGWSMFMSATTWASAGARRFHQLRTPPRACVPARHSQNAQVVMLGINLRFSAR